MKKAFFASLVLLILFYNLFGEVTKDKKNIFFQLITDEDIVSIEDMLNKMNNKEKFELLNAEKAFNFAPLHSAVCNGFVNITKLLLIHGANPNAKNFYGCTPLHIAIDDDNEILAEILIAYNATINAKDTLGKTPLHRAALYGSLKCTKLLLLHKATVDEKDNFGNTALHWVTAIYQTTIARLLIKHGAQINACNKDGKTPLSLLLSRGESVDKDRLFDFFLWHKANLDDFEEISKF